MEGGEVLTRSFEFGAITYCFNLLTSGSGGQ